MPEEPMATPDNPVPETDSPPHEAPDETVVAVQLWRRLTRRRFVAATAVTGVAATAVTLPMAVAQNTNPSATPAEQPGQAITQAAGTGSQSQHAGMNMTPGVDTNSGFTYFVPYQAAIIQAAAARLIPTDDLGPGATEAGVVYFIDRQLSTQKGYRGYRYSSGPFVEGKPSQGDQLGLSMRDRFRLGIFGIDNYAKQLYGNGFAALKPDQQDRILGDLQQGIPQNFALAAVQSTPGTAPAKPPAQQPAQAGIGAKAFFDLLLSIHHRRFLCRSRRGRQPGHGRLETDRLPRRPYRLPERDREVRSAVQRRLHQPRPVPAADVGRVLTVATLPKVDVVFIGFGLAGSAIANELGKRTSLNMVALERGPFRDTFPDFLQDHFDEWRYAVQSELFMNLSQNTVTFRNNDQMTALPMREYGAFLPGNEVGGAMVHWNGVSWRFLPYFFQYRSHLEQRYGRDFLPPDTTIQDWGVTYDELEPYFIQFEKTFGISGKAGNLKGKIIEGGNPFEGSRSEEYPQPPTKTAYGPALFREAARQLGWKPLPQPSANSSGSYTNPDGMTLGPCNYCGFCERFGCHVGAKASPIVTTVPSALNSGRLTIRQYSTVFRINHQDGMATGVSYYDANGLEQEQPADLIVLSAFMLENTRIMLLSQIGKPYDPKAGAGVVGRNFTYQTGGASATIWYDDRIINRFMGGGALGVAIDEFNSDNFDHTGLGFFGGGNISCGQSGARPILNSGPLPPGTATWGSAWKQAVKAYYNTSVSVGMQGECPAYRQNYVDLDPTYKDAFGNPLLRITFDFTDNEKKMVAYVAQQALTRIATVMGGAIQTVNDTLGTFSIVPYQSTHINGGTVMGSDPGTSVVNKYCQSWDVSNLFVVGSSNFPQNAGYNPTGTVGALAYHTADAIVTKYLPSPGHLA